VYGRRPDVAEDSRPVDRLIDRPCTEHAQKERRCMDRPLGWPHRGSSR